MLGTADLVNGVIPFTVSPLVTSAQAAKAGADSSLGSSAESAPAPEASAAERAARGAVAEKAACREHLVSARCLDRGRRPGQRDGKRDGRAAELPRDADDDARRAAGHEEREPHLQRSDR